MFLIFFVFEICNEVFDWLDFFFWMKESGFDVLYVGLLNVVLFRLIILRLRLFGYLVVLLMIILVFFWIDWFFERENNIYLVYINLV